MQIIYNCFYWIVGVVFLLLSKVRSALRGYRSPKPFPASESIRAAKYDIAVVDAWLNHLAAYAGMNSLAGKSVLELGPGSDLGTGLYLLSKEASRYVAVDVNNLAPSAPLELYDALFSLTTSSDRNNPDTLLRELELARAGTGDRLRFVFSPKFDLVSSVPPHSIDLVFSQAAFEHFRDFEGFLKGLDVVTKPGALLIAEVDLCTHSRWIRDKDELNIYRYSNRMYSYLTCPGAPNRLRPCQYRAALKENGWVNVMSKPLRVLSEVRCSAVKHSLAIQFRSDQNEMEQLSIVLCATKR